MAGQRVADGLANGSLYGALALALTIVHRATGRVNLAQGELATLGTYLSLVLATPATAALAGTTTVTRWVPGAPWPLWLAIPGAMVTSAAIAATLERVLVRRVGISARSGLGVTVGLLLLLNAATTGWWRTGQRRFPSPFPTGPDAQFVWRTVRLRFTTVGTWLTLLFVLVLLQLLSRRTRVGLAFRAVASNRDHSSLCGIHVGRLLTGAWALAAALGTLVGCLAAHQVPLTPTIMVRLLVFSLVAATIGGLSSPGGALIGGLLVGVTQSLAAAYLPGIDSVSAFPLLVGVMVIMLYLRPRGLFGERRTEPDDVAPTASPDTAASAVPARWYLRRDDPRVVWGRAAVVVIAVVLAVVPAFVFPFLEARLTTEVIATAIALWGLGLLVGDAGRVSLSHATFMGVGAYTTAIVAGRYDIPPLAGVLLAGLVGFVAGTALGLPALRIRGQFLAMVTLALAVVFPSLLNRFSWFTGGELGPPPTDVPRGPSWLGLPSDRTFAWLHLLVVAAAAAIWWMVRNVRRGAVGRAIRAAAQNEYAAVAMGVNTTRVRTLVFGISSALAAVGGAFVAVQTQAVTSGRFDLFRSLALYALLVVCGAGSMAGASLAAVAFVGTPWLLAEVDLGIGATGVAPGAPGGGAYLLWGAALLGITALLPGGVMPWVSRVISGVVQVVDTAQPTPAREPPPVTPHGEAGEAGEVHLLEPWT